MFKSHIARRFIVNRLLGSSTQRIPSNIRVIPGNHGIWKKSSIISDSFSGNRRFSSNAINNSPRVTTVSAVTPTMALGGLSIAAFSMIYAINPFTTLDRISYESPELVETCRKLQDQNEYLEDTNMYLTLFVEKQKDQIALLKQEISRLRQLQVDLL